MIKGKLETIIYELKNLKEKIIIHRKSSEFIYPNVFKEWVKKYNDNIAKYNVVLNADVEYFQYSEIDLSSTGKTIKNGTLDYFEKIISSFMNRVNDNILEDINENKNRDIPFNQLRKCFKINTMGCPINPIYEKSKVFIGMPFSSEYYDSYNYGISLALNYYGYAHYKADNELSNIDIMCKVCKEIQSCTFAIINISGINPNVMFELGLLYGIGKNVILVKDKATKTITDIKNLEYIEYEHAYDLQQKLIKYIEQNRNVLNFREA